MKSIAFDVTPLWWSRAPASARQLIIAAAGVLLPERLSGVSGGGRSSMAAANIFAVADAVYAYDIRVADNAGSDELETLRQRILDQIDSIRALMPTPWLDPRKSVEHEVRLEDTV